MEKSIQLNPKALANFTESLSDEIVFHLSGKAYSKNNVILRLKREAAANKILSNPSIYMGVIMGWVHEEKAYSSDLTIKRIVRTIEMYDIENFVHEIEVFAIKEFKDE